MIRWSIKAASPELDLDVVSQIGCIFERAVSSRIRAAWPVSFDDLPAAVPRILLRCLLPEAMICLIPGTCPEVNSGKTGLSRSLII